MEEILEKNSHPNKLAAAGTRLAAILLIVSALYRALSLNNLVIGMSTGDIAKHLGASVLIDGGFASMLMLLTAAWLLFLSPELKKGNPKARIQALLIGLSFSFFAGGFWYLYRGSWRLLAFLAVGLLILISAILASKKPTGKSIVHETDSTTDLIGSVKS